MLDQQTEFDPVLAPPPVMRSAYGPKAPEQRAGDIAGMVSLRVRELFPTIAEAIYRDETHISKIREATRAALANVDMSMIGPTDSINILCSEHGFGIIGGHAYAEMLRTIRDVIEERTGNPNARLIVIAYVGFKESDEIIEYYDFETYFKGKVRGATPFDRGVPIETELGTLYGVAKVYNARWIIHCHYDDPREIYLHRMIDRSTKPFGMSYARFETRSIFHMTFGPRSGNLVGRAIAESKFVRDKLAFTCYMLSSPDGVTAIDADNELHAVGERVTVNVLRQYGKMLELFSRLKDCVVVLDGPKWPYYIHAGGMIFGHLLYNGRDWWDVQSDPKTKAELMGKAINPKFKAMVINQALIGLYFPMVCPTIVVGEMAEVMKRDFANPTFMDQAMTAPTLSEALERAKQIGGTDKVIFFDGTYGSINLSPSLAVELKTLAAGVDQLIEAERLPKWLKQRGIDPLKHGIV
ncbi:MAG: hypothetical protein JO303_04160 [Caulobacteraceae bacterium]|nr:hypothetical protein [Caulobacteraceae bacterium]